MVKMSGQLWRFLSVPFAAFPVLLVDALSFGFFNALLLTFASVFLLHFGHAEKQGRNQFPSASTEIEVLGYADNTDAVTKPIVKHG